MSNALMINESLRAATHAAREALCEAYGLDDTPQAPQTPAVALVHTKAVLSSTQPAFVRLRARVWQLLGG